MLFFVPYMLSVYAQIGNVYVGFMPIYVFVGNVYVGFMPIYVQTVYVDLRAYALFEVTYMSVYEHICGVRYMLCFAPTDVS